MATYSFNLYDISSLNVSNLASSSYNPLTNSGTSQDDLDGNGWNYQSQPWAWPTATYPTVSVQTGYTPQKVTIVDTDSDSTHLNDYADLTVNQTLQNDLSINGTTWPAGTVIQDEYEVQFTDSSGKAYTLVAISATTPGAYRSTIIGYTWDNGVIPPEGTVLTYVNNSNADTQTLNPPCFTRGTHIATVRGEVAIEDLTEGDLVLTRDHGPQPLRWIGSVVVSARRLERADKLRPIRISAGALGTAPDGTALPRTDLTVSPQHRILVRSHIAERMFGQPEVLVAARQLLQIPGIDTAGAAQPVEYFHLLFDRHEVIVANGAETESLYTGPEALKLISQAARAEILTLFPELATRDYATSAARVLVSGRQARKLAVRHIQNRKPLVA
ncbi:Hint domain-containing protein [Paenirhodobacter enshiensis]|uniref:Hint domain-containing protein n=1 Tax=Paenirhodobacter enshiensis TaxID=1105367 RepID=UPI0035AFB8BE